jgi:hypothetical protein
VNPLALRNALAINNGSVTLSRGTLGNSLDGFLEAYYQNQPLVISDAALVTEGTDENTVMLTGRATLLGVADLPITARVSLDANGEAQARFAYRLRESIPGPNAWTFTRSFPKLPSVWNYGDSPPADDLPVEAMPAQRPYVESLNLFDSFFVVASYAHRDPEFDVPLEQGINFVTRLRPGGAAGYLAQALSETVALPLSGPVRIPKDTDRTLPIRPGERVWARTDAPGISLSAPLPIDFKVGGLKFDEPKLRIYTPLSSDWMQQNPTFTPVHGVSGRLSIPSAGITLDLAADLKWGLPQAYLSADCKGVTLGKLSQLVDLCGTGSLSMNLPEELRGAVDKLEKLELLYVGLQTSLSGATPTVEKVRVTVGMPNLNWKVWGDNLKVDSISCRFDITNPFSRFTQVAVTVLGTIQVEGVPISIEARSDKGFEVYAYLDGAQTLPLDRLLKTYAPGAPQIGDLTVGTLSLSVAPGRSYAMSMLLAGNSKPWTIPVGRSNLTISDLAVQLSYPKGGPLWGSFAGTARFGKELSLSVGYTLPGNLSLRGTFTDIKLRKLINALCDLAGALPPDFDLTFSSASVLVQQRGNDFVFQLAAALQGVGLFAFESSKVGNQWGFSAGMDLGAVRVSSLPGLSALKPIEDFVRLQKLLLILSTHDNANFQFPDLAQFNAPVLGSKNLALPAQTRGVTKGLMLFAEWQLDPNNKQHGLVMKLLGLGGTQRVTLAIGENPAQDSKLFFGQRGTLAGHPFDYQLGVMLSKGQASFFLTGTMTFNIQGQPQTFDTTMMSVPTGAFFSASMRGSAPVDCKVFKLSNLALQLGVNWGGIPSLGIAATINVDRFQSSVAIFFDSTNPARSLVAGSLSELTLKDVADTLLGGAVPSAVDDVLSQVALRGTQRFKLAGTLADALDSRDIAAVSAAFSSAGRVQIPSTTDQVLLCVNKAGSAWHLTDLTKMRHYALVKRGNDIEVSVEPQFYFAPQPTFIGKISFPQGYYINAALSVAGFDASATVDIRANTGVSVDAQMDKIVLFDERLFSLTALQGGGGPKLSLATFTQNSNPEAKFRPPHFYINGSMTLLGVKQGVFASVSVKGVDFELVGRLLPGVTFDLDARFGKSGLGANGTVKVGVGTIDLGALGKAKINTDLEVDVDLDIDVGGKSVSLSPGGEYGPDARLLSNDLATLVFQGDGNLVLYKTTGANWEPVWASGTNGRGGTMLAFQGDGNLVIYTAKGAPVWATGTNGHGVTKLTLREDGNLVLTDGAGTAKWQTGTDLGGPGASIELETRFTFAGQNIGIARFKLEAKADTFAQLPDIISKKVEDALRDVFKDATKWANAVGDGVMDGVNDTAKVFKDVYGKSEQEAKALANTLNKGVNQSVQAVGNAANDVAKTATQTTKAVENVANDVAKSASKTTKKAIKKVKFW